jgi:hypothetical protein
LIRYHQFSRDCAAQNSNHISGAIINVLIFHSRYPGITKWDNDAKPPRPVRIAGAMSLVLWIGIVVSGRMIAYNWFDCDRQPQSDIINLLTSCVPTE